MKRRQRPEQTSRGTGLRQELQSIADEATAYFNRVASQAHEETPSGSEVWSLVSPDDQQLVGELSSRIRQAVATISNALKPSLIVVQADYAALRLAMKEMIGALQFCFFVDGTDGEPDRYPSLTYSWKTFWHEADRVDSQAISRFMDNHSKVTGFLDLLEVPKPVGEGGTDTAPTAAPLSRFQRRAATVAKLIEELGVLKPQMYSTSDYERLEAAHPDFFTFEIGRKHTDLQQKIVHDEFSRRHILLAQQMAARWHTVKLSTIQTDWKDHKPAEFRQQRGRRPKRGKRTQRAERSPQ